MFLSEGLLEASVERFGIVLIRVKRMHGRGLLIHICC